MDAAELEAYRHRHLRIRRLSWIAVLLGSMGVGFVLCAVWSVPVGILTMIVLANVGLTLHLRWDKARWIKRFPELADAGVAWHRRYWTP